MLKNLQVDDHAKNLMTDEIKIYFLEERGEELGDLAALLILEFVADKLAPHFYTSESRMPMNSCPSGWKIFLS
ncbi:DUF2164 family protein [Mesobacillus boroniphilus]|uniref:Uncharacterized protein n=1 Tax=Mesobacillus boroniphilus JCM 21738 TaxID=1294265 RepID=W4RMQ6_9BACI|nr:DUF2164 family protein [Mesobacillus boroniphilus]GAE44879.1 hypothetical protein JCM21738_1629 [Mesobacillus boroniphilus JCM 21738]